jgi:hypothetical protein
MAGKIVSFTAGARKSAGKAAGLRESIKGKSILENLAQCEQQFRELYTQMVDDANFTKDEAPVYNAKVSVVRQRAELNFRLLNKLLPDLKSLDITDDLDADAVAARIRELLTDMDEADGLC